MLLEPVLLKTPLAAVLDGDALTFGTSVAHYVLSINQIMFVEADHVSNMTSNILLSFFIVAFAAYLLFERTDFIRTL